MTLLRLRGQEISPNKSIKAHFPADTVMAFLSAFLLPPPFTEAALNPADPASFHLSSPSLQDAFEVLAECYEFNQMEGRCLAFRRAASVLKSLPAALGGLDEARHLPCLGDHAKAVIGVRFPPRLPIYSTFRH